MTNKFDPKHAEANGYTLADWQAVDTADLDDTELATATKLEDAAPELADKMKAEISKRGRPPLANPKVAVSIRLDSDLVKQLKAGGRGWQSRANALLRHAMGI